MTTPLTKTETKHLMEAAGEGGTLTLPESLKPASRERLLGRLTRDGLIATSETGHVLTPAGYRAVGLRPPRVKPVALVEIIGEPKPASKKDLVRDLLARAEGATMAELIAATGWLPHTTRAALSRIRSAGQELSKSTREDGTIVYRILPDEPAPKRTGRRRAAEGPEAATAA